MVLLSESQYCLLSSPVGSDANEFQGQKYFLDAIVGDSFRFGDIASPRFASLFITKKHPQLLFFGVVAKVDQVQEEPIELQINRWQFLDLTFYAY